jgi:hypothetical protein
MIPFKQFVTEEAKETPLHTELKSLSNDTYHEPGGGSSVSTTRFRGGKNEHFGKIHKMMLDRGYKRVYAGNDRSEYHKPLDGGKRNATVVVNHKDNHVHSVETLTQRIHY